MGSADSYAYATLFFVVSLGWLYYFGRHSDHLRIGTLLTVFAVGFVVGPGAGLLNDSLPGLIGGRRGVSDFVLFFLIVGPVEELTKFGATLIGALRRSDFRNAGDGLVLAIAAALGFACGENLLYLAAFGPERTLPRLVLGNLGHAAYAAFWGYGLGVTLHERASPGILIATLTIAALLHGLYDFLLGTNKVGAIVALVLNAVLFIGLFAFLRSERKRNRGGSSRG